jgi:hypothetical protein
LDLRVFLISIEREAMVRFAVFSHKLWDTSETPNREAFVVVICFKDSADSRNSLLILITAIEEMKATWI